MYTVYDAYFAETKFFKISQNKTDFKILISGRKSLYNGAAHSLKSAYIFPYI